MWGARGGGDQVCDEKGLKGIFRADQVFYIVILVTLILVFILTNNYTGVVICQNSSIFFYFKCVHFIVCKLYHNEKERGRKVNRWRFQGIPWGLAVEK